MISVILKYNLTLSIRFQGVLERLGIRVTPLPSTVAHFHSKPTTSPNAGPPPPPFLPLPHPTPHCLGWHVCSRPPVSYLPCYRCVGRPWEAPAASLCNFFPSKIISRAMSRFKDSKCSFKLIVITEKTQYPHSPFSPPLPPAGRPPSLFSWAVPKSHCTEASFLAFLRLVHRVDSHPPTLHPAPSLPPSLLPALPPHLFLLLLGHLPCGPGSPFASFDEALVRVLPRLCVR